MQNMQFPTASMADSFYNLMNESPEKGEYAQIGRETADGAGFVHQTRPGTRGGVNYEQVNAANINANIRRSMDRQQRVQTAQPNKQRAKKAYQQHINALDAFKQ